MKIVPDISDVGNFNGESLKAVHPSLDLFSRTAGLYRAIFSHMKVDQL